MAFEWIAAGLAVALIAWGAYRLRQPEHTHGRSRLLWASQRASEEKRNFLVKVRDWIWEYLQYRTRRKRDVLPYPPDDSGIYPLTAAAGGDTVRLAFTGDWGKGPDSRAGAVAAAMEAGRPDFTVHLGDIYPVGRSADVRRNFLGMGADGVRWPEGLVGTLALPGNHEYQSGGHAFFDEVLPAMHIVVDGRSQPQRTSFFCLENVHWRVIGLDTGNESVHRFGKEAFFHLLNKIPFINRLAWVQDHKTWLPETEMEWLRDVLASERDDPRGLIFMSHHQVYTALDRRGGNPKPGKQVASLLPPGREAIWFHGHGHIQGTYRMQRLRGAANDFSLAARAVGHGSDVDPVNLQQLRRRICQYQLEYVDNRGDPKAKKIKSPHNGFAVLTFRGPELEVRYFTLRSVTDEVETVMAERWTVSEGVLTGPDYGEVLAHQDIVKIEDRFECLPPRR